MKKVLSVVVCLCMSAVMFAGCSNSNSSEVDETKGKVYYQAFKPEQDAAFKKIAKKYTEKTGVDVKVITAAAGTYETTLKVELGKGKKAPTIFQINGPVGYQSWKDYCADISDTELYKHLVDQTSSISKGDAVYGIPYVIEGYGIIYNKAIIDKYIATDNAKIQSIDEIKNFATLKKVVEDMQAKKDQLKIKGVFASTSLKTGEGWRWQTHLSNIPLYYEWKDGNVDLMNAKQVEEIKFKYAENYKNIFDLYTNNSTIKKKLLSNKSVDDSMAEFALGKAAMVQNGNWGWGQIAKVTGNTVKEEDIGFLPIYTGVEGEEKQGLCIGTENFICVNSKVSEADQKASKEFLDWLYTSEEGTKLVVEELGFIAPFDTFGEDMKPKDPLALQVSNFNANKELDNVPWNFTVYPSQKFKDDFEDLLRQYVSGKKTWDDVKKSIINNWKTEKEIVAP